MPIRSTISANKRRAMYCPMSPKSCASREGANKICGSTGGLASVVGGGGPSMFGRSKTAPHAEQNADEPGCSLPHEGQVATPTALQRLRRYLVRHRCRRLRHRTSVCDGAIRGAACK